MLDTTPVVMALPVPDLLKRLAIFLFMQVLGAIQALKEQTVDRHRPLKRESQRAKYYCPSFIFDLANILTSS